MAPFLEGYRTSNAVVPEAFLSRLEQDFVEYKGCWFFPWVFGRNVRVTLDGGSEADLSYFEHLSNKTYVDEFSKGNVFHEALASFDRLATLWDEKVAIDVDLVLLFQTGGVAGHSAALSFNVIRAGYPVFHERNISAFNHAVLLRHLRY